MNWVNHMIKINNKFKFQMFGRNFLNLEKVYTNIPRYDPDHKHLMDEHTFNLFLNACGIFFSTQEIRIIKDSFGDKNGVKYIDFLENVRRDINPKRMATIDHCWDELSDGNVIVLSDLLAIFCPDKHPHTRCKIKKPEEVEKDFIESISKRSSDGKHLTELEFKEYYLDVNACIPF